MEVDIIYQGAFIENDESRVRSKQKPPTKNLENSSTKENIIKGDWGLQNVEIEFLKM